MPLVTLREVLPDAVRNGYAVGAFNAHTMDAARAILKAAESEKAPVIVQLNQAMVKFTGLDYAVAMVKTGADTARVPVVLHLDHGTDAELAIECVQKGFSSVMFDGSRLPYSENVATLQRIVEYAHARGVSVEGELGRIGGTEDDISLSDREATFTVPGEAAKFAQVTAIDALAVAIGTAHGFYKGVPHLDLPRLAAIKKATPVPLVLHGGSGIPDAMIRQAVEAGACKVNVATEVKAAFTEGLKEWFAGNPDDIDPRKYLAHAMDAVFALVTDKIRLFGSSGRA